MYFYISNIFRLALRSLILVAAFETVANAQVISESISDTNATVSFEVDSTWVLVHGSTGNLSGSYKIDYSSMPAKVEGKLSIPLESFKTGNSSRDKHLLEVMAAAKYKTVAVRIEGFKRVCLPSNISPSNLSCTGSLLAKLSIRDVTKDVELPYTLEKDKEGNLHLAGSIPVKWGEYNVEDPSILIAKLNPIVNVSYSVKVPKQ